MKLIKTLGLFMAIALSACGSMANETPETAGEACTAASAALCDRAAECSPDDPTLASCARDIAAECCEGEECNDRLESLDPDVWDACIDAFAVQSCDQLAELPAACRNLSI